MKHDTHLLQISLGIGAMVFLSACAGDMSGGSTPSEKLPAPSRSAAAETSSQPPKAGMPPWSASPPFSSHDFEKPLPLKAEEGMEVAILAGGCFWCLEAVYELLPGVTDVVSGYIGGTGDRPTYQYVSSGASGYAEAVRIVYDPKRVGYGELLDLFWKIHNPTTPNRQGYDVGTQYRSAIYYLDEAQRLAAEAAIGKQRSVWEDSIVTEVSPAADFWIAEEYHQDFYRLNPDYGYCAVVIAPKVDKSGLAK